MQAISLIQEVFDHFCDEYANNKTWDQICSESGMADESTIRRWIARYPACQVQYLLARERRADRLVDEAMSIADDRQGDTKVDEKTGKTVVNWENVNRSKIRVDVRKWAASRLAPLKWGDKLQIDGTLNVKDAEDSPDDRARKLKAIVEEYSSRGGDVTALFSLMGISPVAIQGQKALKQAESLSNGNKKERENTD
jgi:hypothetical protein